ncbi:PA14 domain-containing protein [Streptomyces sp. NPDC048603]|uniref:PA14 domain-containing protein n=1 Tax=Streptomyces sp. NPDC048603 TaxID=3365577 RepID=UPI00372452A8
MTRPPRALPRTLRTTAACTVAATTAGLLTAAGAAAPTAAAAGTACTGTQFTRQFFANTTFSGTAKKTDCDSAVNETWSGAPAAGLPADKFGVRWSLTRDFGSGGPFTFTVAARDGIRVHLDGVRKTDLWKDVTTTQTKTVNVTVPSGRHTLRIDFVNWTGPANASFSYVPRTSAADDKVKPLAPARVAAVLDHATARAKVSWAANKEMDLAGYRVYRRLDGSTTTTLVKTLPTSATGHAEVPPTAGRTYHYTVRAFDKAGNTSDAGAAAPLPTVAVTAPAGVTARGEDTGITLTWKPVPGAVRYQVRRMDTATVGTVTGTRFTDTTVARSQQHDYQVAAVDGAGRVSPYSAWVRAKRAPAPVRELTATATRPGEITLTWKTDPNTDGTHTGFRVHRSTTLPVSTTGEPAGCTPLSDRLPDGRIQYTCTTTGVASQTKYHYVVVGVGDRDFRTAPSNTATVTSLYEDRTPPPAVTGLTATATEYGIVLKWNPVTAPDLKRYELYAGSLLGDEGEQVCSAGVIAYLGPETTTYVRPVLPDGDQGCYFVDAIDTNGNSSFRWTGNAHVVTATELDLTPSVETPQGGPLGVNAEPSTDGKAVELTWNPAGAADGATAYRVDRWNPATKAYEKLAQTSAASPTAYTDTTARTGTTHFYRVTAIRADGTETGTSGDWVILQPR